MRDNDSDALERAYLILTRFFVFSHTRVLSFSSSNVELMHIYTRFGVYLISRLI